MKKCIQCNNMISEDKDVCNMCGYNFNKKDPSKIKPVIYKTILIGYIVFILISCYSLLKPYINEYNYDIPKEEACMLDCGFSGGYIYNSVNDECRCVSAQEEREQRCKNRCLSDIYYINNDYDCVCNNGEKIYSGDTLIYSSDEEYEYEDNFNAWLQDIKSDELVVNVIANSSCIHCSRYQPIVHNFWRKYKFKLHMLHTDKLSESEIDELFSLDLPNYNGTPYTFITLNGEVIDYLGGNVSGDSLDMFLRNNNVIN